MGNTHGIPAASNDEWVVLVMPRNGCQAILVPPDHDADARLVDLGNTPRASSGCDRGRGLVPRREYDEKLRQFNATIGGGRRRVTTVASVGIALVVVLPHALRLLSEDIEVWMYLVASYVPILLLMTYMCRHYAAESGKVTALFDPWRERFGIEVAWYRGGKHAASRLGFKLPTTAPPMVEDHDEETMSMAPFESGDLRSQLAA